MSFNFTLGITIFVALRGIGKASSKAMGTWSRFALLLGVNLFYFRVFIGKSECRDNSEQLSSFARIFFFLLLFRITGTLASWNSHY